MKTYIKMAKSLMKKNKGLTIGIFLMSVAMIVVGILGGNMYPSATDSINSYIESSNLPDKLYTTNILSTSIEDNLLSIEGVNEVDYRFVANTNFELEQDGIFSGLLITYNENDLNHLTFIKETDTEPDVIKSYLPIGFANRHNVKEGDKLTLYINNFKIETVIKALISSPEVLYGDKDFMSIHETYSYSKLYVDINDLDKLLHIKDRANQWLVYLDSSLNEEAKESTLTKVESVIGEKNIINAKDFESSKRSLLSLKPNLEAVNTLGLFFIALICFLTLGFSFIFIQIIIRKERKTIGLLKALGYKRKHIVLLFSIYVSLINIPAILIGFPLSYLVLKGTLLGMEISFFFPLNNVSISPISVISLLLSVLFIGLLSSILSSSQIGKIEPSEVYGENEEVGRESTKLLKRLKLSQFSKISLSSMRRSLLRQIVGSLCIAACILFMFVSTEGCAAHSKVVAGGYGDAYTYEYLIRSIDEQDYNNIKNSLSSYEIIEPNIYIDAETSVGGKRIVACPEDTSFITLRDKNDNVLSLKEGIIIDQFTAEKNDLKVGDNILVFDKEVEIKGIAIEYTSAISFISLNTASLLGFNDINGAMVKLKDTASETEFNKELNNLNRNIYIVKMIDQKIYAYDKYSPVSIVLVVFGCFSFLVGTLLIVNISFIDFLELRKKYATLRALGVPMKKIMRISLFENGIRCLLGVLLSLPLCYFSAELLFTLLTSSSAYYAMINFFLYFALSASICILYLVISVLITYFAIKKLDFAQNLNSRE